MIKNYNVLVKLCEDEIKQREYRIDYYSKIVKYWNELSKWMIEHNFENFSSDLGFRYCDEVIGSHLIVKNMKKSMQLRLRAIRMIISYQINGDFEFRSPRIEKNFDGSLGIYFKKYLAYCENELNLSYKTIDNKKYYLWELAIFLEYSNYSFKDFNLDIIKDFFSSRNYSLSSRHNANRTIKLFLHYLYDNKVTDRNLSILIMRDNYNKRAKLPTTYSELEIKKMIESVERSSAIGKRDYLILLLAAEYGLRSSDIVNFGFEHIDWEENKIKITQHKTKTLIEYDLLASIGNAIIDYLKHGRPKSSISQILVSHELTRKNNPLSAPTIHSIVAKYFRKANIDYSNKKHGPHSLRHSLATNLLKKNISIPIIGSILGHQSTESTNIYLSIDINSLRKCPLPAPVNTISTGEND